TNGRTWPHRPNAGTICAGNSGLGVGWYTPTPGANRYGAFGVAEPSPVRAARIASAAALPAAMPVTSDASYGIAPSTLSNALLTALIALVLSVESGSGANSVNATRRVAAATA